MGWVLHKPGPLACSVVGSSSLRAAPYLAVQFLQDGVALLGALFVVAHHLQLLQGEAADARVYVFHG